MPTVWTADRLQKLLLLIVDNINLSAKNIAELPAKWSLAFPNEEYQPTGRAIQEQLLSLKKTHNLKLKGGSTASGPSTPRGPRAGPSSGTKRKTPQSFSTGKGRSKKQATGHDSNDDDDDDDEEEEAKYMSFAPRQTPSRRSRSTTINYREADDIIELDEDEDDIEVVVKSEGGDTVQPFKLRDTPQAESPLRSKSHKIFERANLIDSVDDDTDTSEYRPLL